MLTGMVFVFYCNWAVLLCLSVQAYENLALHKPAWQSTTRWSKAGAERAVDGQYTNLTWYGGQCAASRWNQTAEWWVDLGRVKKIHHVLIHHVDWYRWVLLGFSVYISNTTNKEDGVLCFRDTIYSRATIPNPVNITCPYHGRYVIYFNNRTHPPYPEGYYDITIITLCEIEVYECPSPGYYGENCSLDCPQNCQNGYCDSVEGTCLACKIGFIGPRCKDCADGFFGNNCHGNCSMTCGEPGVCDKVTGHCNGSCLPGWEGNMCQSACLVGFYGVNCLQNCSMTCGIPGNCDRIKGYCNGGCQRGWAGTRCEKECAAGSFGNNCTKNCSLTCGDPGVCDKVTGHCNGSCLAGWEGDMCENECSKGFYGVICIENCSMTCGIPGNCDKITGYCNGGCQRGWTGVKCEKECAAGSFGNNCTKNCSLTCGDPGVCDKVTGHCNGSCLAGWEGDMCENECSKGLYGVNCVENCSMTCGIPGNCDKITGYCNGGCQCGWTGVRCEEGTCRVQENRSLTVKKQKSKSPQSSQVFAV